MAEVLSVRLGTKIVPHGWFGRKQVYERIIEVVLRLGRQELQAVEVMCATLAVVLSEGAYKVQGLTLMAEYPLTEYINTDGEAAAFVERITKEINHALGIS